MKFSLSVVAYSKIVLHACRYPHRGVNGVLLGHVDDGDVLRLVDAVPLFHFALGLVPMLEVALCQVWCSLLVLFSVITFLGARFYMPACLVRSSVCLSVCLPVFVCFSVCLSVCLFVFDCLFS